jgi:uncharacterized FlaG/YvyC family protein
MGPSSSSGPVGPSVNRNSGEPAHVDPHTLEEAVAKLNSANAAGNGNEIVVTIEGHRLTIQVVDRDTREVVDQISPPSLFRMYRKLNS